MASLSSILRAVWHRIRPRLIGRVAHARKLGVRIGRDCRIYISEWGSEPFLITIGDQVTVTDGVRFITHDGSTWLFRDEEGQRYQKYAPIRVGDHVFIGMGTMILPGISIGDRCVVGAGSVVTRDIESGSVCVGNPARKVSTYEDLKKKIERTGVGESELRSSNGYRERVRMAVDLANQRQA